MPSGTLRLGTTDKALLSVEIVVAYVRARRLLSRVELTSALERVRSNGGSRPSLAGTDAEAASLRLARAVARTLQVFPADATCLTQSVVLTSILARRSIASSVVIGVRTDPTFAAHAWVEKEGQPLLSTKGYSRLLAL